MLWKIPDLWIALLNVGGLLLVHFGVSVLSLRLAIEKFRPEAWLYRERKWEKGGEIYDRLFRVKNWKRRLPDAAPWFKGGFSKKRFRSRDPEYLKRFLLETCRGEYAHWGQIGVLPLFLVWNPWWAWLIVLFYGLAMNLPCIVVQRYNRFWLLRTLVRP